MEDRGKMKVYDDMVTDLR